MTTYDYSDILSEASKVARGEATGGDNSEKVELDGIFDLKVVYAVAKNTKSNGDPATPQISAILEVQTGPQTGDSAWFNAYITPKSKGRFGKQMLDMGISGELLQALGHPDPSATKEDIDAHLMAGLAVIAEELLGWEGEMKAGRSNGFATFEVTGAVASAAPAVASPFAAAVANPLQASTPVAAASGFIPNLG